MQDIKKYNRVEIEKAFYRYHTAHQNASKSFLNRTIFTKCLDEYIESVSRAFPYLKNDLNLSACVTKLDEEKELLTYTVRLKGARTCGVTYLCFNKDTKMMTVRV